jgi:hypothetical protein
MNDWGNKKLTVELLIVMPDGNPLKLHVGAFVKF